MLENNGNVDQRKIEAIILVLNTSFIVTLPLKDFKLALFANEIAWNYAKKSQCCTSEWKLKMRVYFD